MAAGKDELVPFPMTRAEFVAIIALSNLAASMLVEHTGDTDMLRLLWTTANKSLDKLGPSGWEALMERSQGIQREHWPDLMHLASPEAPKGDVH
jgi:hypothetical protein